MLPTIPPYFWRLGEGDEPPGRGGVTGDVLGHDLGCFVVVRDDGSVVARNPANPLSERLVNSTLKVFERALRELASWYGPELGDDEAARQSDRLRGLLAELDPEAVRSPEAWWPLVLEQIEAGT